MPKLATRNLFSSTERLEYRHTQYQYLGKEAEEDVMRLLQLGSCTREKGGGGGGGSEQAPENLTDFSLKIAKLLYEPMQRLTFYMCM